MDKIREQFSYLISSMNSMEYDFNSSIFSDYIKTLEKLQVFIESNYKSRDEEIKRIKNKKIESLKQNCENLVALNNDLSMRLRRADSQIVINKQKKEIKKLGNTLSTIINLCLNDTNSPDTISDINIIAQRDIGGINA